jgi:hypothetical protein
MKKPENLDVSASRIWDVFDAWQRIDWNLARRGCKYSRNLFRQRFKSRLKILRTGSL